MFQLGSLVLNAWETRGSCMHWNSRFITFPIQSSRSYLATPYLLFTKPCNLISFIPQILIVQFIMCWAQWGSTTTDKIYCRAILPTFHSQCLSLAVSTKVYETIIYPSRLGSMVASSVKLSLVSNTCCIFPSLTFTFLPFLFLFSPFCGFLT